MPALLESWLMELESARKSGETRKAYRSGVSEFLKFCEANQLEGLTKSNVQAWLASMSGREAATVRLRLTAVKLFTKWLVAEGELDASAEADALAVATVKAPALDQKVVTHLTEREMSALLRACKGEGIRDRRDYALALFFADTGARASEVVGLDVADVSLADRTATIRRGKGAQGRRVTFSPDCATAIDRYLRARRRAGYSGEALWLSDHGRLSYTGMSKALKARADAAGIPNYHLHRMRHSLAVKWLRQGGSEGGLLAQAGWKSRKMLDRYVKSAAEELASDEFDRLNIRWDN